MHRPRQRPRWRREASLANVLFGSILLQKSTRLGLRAKMRNNRIGTDEFLNQRCVVVFDLESILLAPLPDSQCLLMMFQRRLSCVARLASTASFGASIILG